MNEDPRLVALWKAASATNLFNCAIVLNPMRSRVVCGRAFLVVPRLSFKLTHPDISFVPSHEAFIHHEGRFNNEKGKLQIVYAKMCNATIA